MWGVKWAFFVSSESLSGFCCWVPGCSTWCLVLYIAVSSLFLFLFFFFYFFILYYLPLCVYFCLLAGVWLWYLYEYSMEVNVARMVPFLDGDGDLSAFWKDIPCLFSLFHLCSIIHSPTNIIQISPHLFTSTRLHTFPSPPP